MAKTNDDAIRARVAAQLAKVADRSATIDMVMEGVIYNLTAVEDVLCMLPRTSLSSASQRVIDKVHSDIVLARMSLRGALNSSSPTDALWSIVDELAPKGGVE